MIHSDSMLHTRCTWIDPYKDTYAQCCEHKPLPGRAYCAEHYARVYRTGTALRGKKQLAEMLKVPEGDVRVEGTIGE